MKFTEAVKMADKFKHLIGRKYKGSKLDEIIVVPTDCCELEKFEKMYINTLDAQKSITPFVDSEVRIVAVFDKRQIRQNNLFIYTPIEQIDIL